jgi:hypothetical protein
MPPAEPAGRHESPLSRYVLDTPSPFKYAGCAARAFLSQDVHRKPPRTLLRESGGADSFTEGNEEEVRTLRVRTEYIVMCDRCGKEERITTDKAQREDPRWGVGYGWNNISGIVGNGAKNVRERFRYLNRGSNEERELCPACFELVGQILRPVVEN